MVFRIILNVLFSRHNSKFRMDFEVRRQAYKKGIDASSAQENRKRQTAQLRQKQKEALYAERRSTSNVLFGGSSAATAQLEQWKQSLQSGTDVDNIRRTAFELAMKPLALSPSEQQLFMQVLLLSAQECPGHSLLQLFPLMLGAIKTAPGEIVRLAALYIITALENDDDDVVNTYMWEHDEDPIGVILASFGTQRVEIQRVLMLCIKTVLSTRNFLRITKILPFLCSIMQTSNDLCTMALDCVNEMSRNATLEELQLIRDCGIIAFVVRLVSDANPSCSGCIGYALNVFDAFAEFSEGSDAPSIWLISDGALHAMTKLVTANWTDDIFAELVSRITANLAVSSLGPVLVHGMLCSTIIQYINDSSDEVVREEALNLVLNLIKLPGLDAVRVQTLCDFETLDALVCALSTFAKSNTVMKGDILMCIRDMLAVSPVHANDFASADGIEALMEIGATSEGYLQTMCMTILSQHFPSVLVPREC